MKKFFTVFFVFLGIIFFCLLLALAYFWIADPYNIKPIIFKASSTAVEKGESTDNNKASGNKSETIVEAGIEANGTSTNTGGLTEGQKNALEIVGIDPKVLPSELTKEQEQCFVQKFGQARVDEIKAGSVPTAMEVLTGRNCL